MRSGWASGATVAAAAVLVTGLLWWGTADQVAGGDPDHAATALVPPDGTRVVGITGDRATEVTEHARLTGPEMVLASPPLVGGALTTTLDGDPYGWRIWRATTTTYDLDADASPEQTTTLRRLTDDGIEQVAAYGPFPVVFDPPLLEIPADVHDGSTWSGSGSAMPGGDIDYETDFAAQDAGDGCLHITGSVAFLRGGESLLDSPTDETWCRGRGIVPDDEEPAPGFDGTTQPMVPAVGDVEEWDAHDSTPYVANSVDTLAETGALVSLGVDVPPAGTGDGRLVVANGHGRDVLGFSRVEGAMVRTWVGHPGGATAVLATSGDVTVAGTSRREAVAYGPRGQWLWTHPMDEVPSATPLAVDAGHLVLTSASGEVDVVDPATGESLWSASLRDRVHLTPVSDGATVVAADTIGRIAGFDLDSGDRVWTAEVDQALAMAVVGDVLVVRTPAAAQAYDVASGDRLWSSRLRTGSGSPVVADLGRTVALSSDEDTVGLDITDGRELWRTDGADVSLAVDRHLFQLTEHRLAVRGPDGAVVDRWDLTQLRGTTEYLAAAEDGVWAADAVGGAVEVGP